MVPDHAPPSRAPTPAELQYATDPDAPLPGEDPDTPYVDDAVHWIRVYGELLALKEAVLITAEDALTGASDDAVREAGIDQGLMTAEAHRYRRRREFWRARVRELAAAEAAGKESGGPQAVA